MKKFFASIPVKICLAVLGIETLLLAIMGVYYARKLCEEVDRNLSNKVSMPATLLSEQVLNLDSGLSLELFEKLLQEKIHDVFIVKPDGIIDYSADPEQRDSYYESYLDEEERKQFQKNNQNFSETQIVSNQYKGENFISVLSPIKSGNHLTGVLYIRIDGDVIAARKKKIITFLVIGSLVTIILTSLFEVLLLHYLFVPRINKTIAVLSLVERGNLSARIPQAHSLDQLGSLMRHVNRMIAATERNTQLLQMVNKAGASFVTAENLEKLSELINQEVSNLQIYVEKPNNLAEKSQDNKKQALAPDPDQGFQLPSINCLNETEKEKGDEEKYLYPLLSMANSAFFRLQSWQQTREAEKKYRMLFSSAVEGIFSWTPDGRLEVANPSLAKMMGYESPQAMIEHFQEQNALRAD